MNKKTLFWIFLILGIVWILGISYWYLWIENLSLAYIDWEGNFYSKDLNTQAFFKAVSLLIVPLVITALLFYIIGLLFAKRTIQNISNVENENKQLKTELAQSLDKIETMKVLYTGGKIKRKLPVKKEKQSVESKLEAETQIHKDDLKIIDGIGERIEFFLNDSGIYTWKQLSQRSEEEFRNILEMYGGVSYRIHNPSHWSKQAQLASEGKWEELKQLKEKLKHN